MQLWLRQVSAEAAKQLCMLTPLDHLLTQFSLRAGVFYTGNICGLRDFEWDDTRGHIHLFARRHRLERYLESEGERTFARWCGAHASKQDTRHLLAIGFDAKGLPVSLFAVNAWVTGDSMLSSGLTLQLLASMQLDTGHPEPDAVIVSVMQLCQPQLAELMKMRDMALGAQAGSDKPEATRRELLSEIPIDLDACICRSRREHRKPLLGPMGKTMV